MLAKVRSIRVLRPYLFANRRANLMKMLVHDGIGVWLATRRLNSGKFVWPRDAASTAALIRDDLIRRSHATCDGKELFEPMLSRGHSTESGSYREPCSI